MAKIKQLNTKRGLIGHLMTNPPVGFTCHTDYGMRSNSYSLIKKGLFAFLSEKVASIHEEWIFLHQPQYLESIKRWVEKYEKSTGETIEITISD